MAAGALASSWGLSSRSDVTQASAVSSAPSTSASAPSGNTSGLDSLDDAGPSEITIPSTGLEFFEYRRACFLAGRPVPVASAHASASTAPRSSATLPETYTVPPPPPPAPPVAYAPAPNSSVGRLEALLSDFGQRDRDGAVAWNGGVGSVHRSLTGGRRLAKGLRLGLVIKILKAGWLRDGTWPTDPGTAMPYAVPDSPERSARSLEPCSYPPIHEGRRPRPIRASTHRGPPGTPMPPAPSSAAVNHPHNPYPPPGVSASSAAASSPQAPASSTDASRPRQILPIPMRGARGAGPAMRHMEERA